MGWQDGLTTSQRGLGASHQRARRVLLAKLQDGDPYARCASKGIYHAMFTRYARLLEVDDFPGRVFGGPQTKALSWRRCNRQAGAIVGNKLRGLRRKAASGYTRW